VLALLAARFLLPGDTNIASVSSPSPAESQITIGSLPVGTAFVFSDAPTLPPDVVPTGLHIHATPTPVPVITLPPPTPTPKATATPGPGATRTPAPSHTPTPSKTPVATHASFTFTACTTGGGFLVNFDASASTGSGTLTYDWNFDDNGATGTGVTTSHTYPDVGTYTVFLTVTGTSGPATISKTVTCT
jgi:PKD repeat protein